MTDTLPTTEPLPTPRAHAPMGGRPPIHGETMVRRSIGVTAAEYQRLQYLAWRDRLSFPELVRRALARLE